MSKADMKFKNIYYSSPRQSGRTHTIVQGCLATGATLVCQSHAQEKQLKRQYPQLKTINVNDGEKLLGRHDNLVFDHFAYEQLWLEREEEFERFVKEMRERKLGNEQPSEDKE